MKIEGKKDWWNGGVEEKNMTNGERKQERTRLYSENGFMKQRELKRN